MPEWFLVGAQLAVMGMGLVFLVLALLWGLTALVLRLDRPPAPGGPASQPAPGTGQETGPGLDAGVAAAITVAVLAHRDALRKQAAPTMRTHQPGSLPSRWLGTGRVRQNAAWQPRRR